MLAVRKDRRKTLEVECRKLGCWWVEFRMDQTESTRADDGTV